jgi:hypothetical protein
LRLLIAAKSCDNDFKKKFAMERKVKKTVPWRKKILK